MASSPRISSSLSSSGSWEELIQEWGGTLSKRNFDEENSALKKTLRASSNLFFAETPAADSTDPTLSFFDRFNDLSLNDTHDNALLVPSLLDNNLRYTPLSLRTRMLALRHLEVITIEDANLLSNIDCLRNHPVLKKVGLAITLNNDDDSQENYGTILENYLDILASLPNLNALSFLVKYEEDIILSPSINPVPFVVDMSPFKSLVRLNMSFDNKPTFSFLSLEGMSLQSLQLTFALESDSSEVITYRNFFQPGDEPLTIIEYPYLAFNNVEIEDLHEFSYLSLLQTVRELSFENIKFTEELADETLSSYGRVKTYAHAHFENCTMTHFRMESIETYFEERTLYVFGTHLVPE